VLVLTNLVSLIFLAIIAFHYKVPQKVLMKMGIIEYNNQDVNQRYIARDDLFSKYQQMQYRIVMLGDSITEWISWNELLGITDIANRGIAGDTTEGFYNRLSTVYSVNPEMCFIMGGINDIHQGISVNEITISIKKLIEELTLNGIKPIIQSTLYVSIKYPNWKKVNKIVDELNNEIKKICIEKDIIFMDINAVLSIDGALKKENTYDGVHLTGYGYTEWGKLLKPIIETH